MPVMPGHTRHMNNRTSSRGPHRRNNEAREKNRSAQVNLQNQIDGLRLNHLRLHDWHHRGIIHQAIDPIEATMHPRNERLDFSGISHIDSFCKDIGTALPNEAGGLMKSGFVQVADTEARSFFGECQCDSAPDAVSRTGYNAYLAF